MPYKLNPFTGQFDYYQTATGFLTKSQADTYYYPLSTNPAGYLTKAVADGYYDVLGAAAAITAASLGAVPYSGATGDVNLGVHNLLLTGTLGAGAITSTGLLGVTVASGYAATFMGGNVGIGTTGPNNILDVNTGSSAGYGNYAQIRTSQGTGYQGGLLITNYPGTTAGYNSLKITSSYNGGTSSVAQIGFVLNSATETFLNSGPAIQLNYNGNVLLAQGGGDVGIGTTSPQSALQIGVAGNGSLLFSATSTIASNAYVSGVWKYGGNGTASLIDLSDNSYAGDITFYTAASGTAGSAITFVNPMTIYNSGALANTLVLKAGKVGIGTTSPGSPLTVVGASSFDTGNITTDGYGNLSLQSIKTATSALDNITVSGTGGGSYGSPNGTYTPYGTSGGKPRWWMTAAGSPSGYWYIVWNGGYWGISANSYGYAPGWYNTGGTFNPWSGATSGTPVVNIPAPITLQLEDINLLSTPAPGSLEADGTGNLYFTSANSVRNLIPTVNANNVWYGTQTIGQTGAPSYAGNVMSYVDGGGGTFYQNIGRYGGTWYWQHASAVGTTTQMLLDDYNAISLYNSTSGTGSVTAFISPVADSYFTGGRVGIGVTTPRANLHIVNSGALTSFTGTTTSNVLLGGAVAASNGYDTIDFTQTSNWNIPDARIGAKFTGSGSYLQFGTSNSYGSGITNTAMTIDYNGNVGIGTTSPTYNLEIGNNTSDTVRISAVGSNTSTANLLFGSNSLTSQIAEIQGIYGSSWNGVLTFSTQTTGGSDANRMTERMRIDSSGNVGIGTTSPTALLTLAAGVASANGAPFKLTAGTLLTTPELGAIEFTDNGTTSHLYVTINIAGVLTRYAII